MHCTGFRHKDLISVFRLTISLFCVFFLLPAFAADEEVKPVNRWHLLAGGGSSHIGWGDTKQTVKTTDVIFRQKRPQLKTRGSGWYLNRKSVLVEIPITYLREPDEPGMIGFTMNVSWSFIASRLAQPFVLIGGGPVYTQAKIPGTSSQLKGSYQLGLGVEFKVVDVGMSLEWRYHHLSNGGFKKPNDSLNSGKLLLGVKLPF
jgi:opacity protein-like surface antigen